MSKPTGRFNLRTRKSLRNQLECVSCKRYYFPLELQDDDVNEEETKNMCCDCTEKQQPKAPPKRRAVSIKVEKPDSNNDDDQCQTSQSNATKKGILDHDQRIVVQIHSMELLEGPSTSTANTNATASKFFL